MYSYEELLSAGKEKYFPNGKHGRLGNTRKAKKRAEQQWEEYINLHLITRSEKNWKFFCKYFDYVSLKASESNWRKHEGKTISLIHRAK
jgi:hypothetical protein